MSNSPCCLTRNISDDHRSLICDHTVWRTWLFIAYLDERWLLYSVKKFSQPHLWGWENVLFERGSEGVKGDISGNSTCHRGVYAPPCKRDCIHMAHSTWIGWCVGDCWSNWKGTIYKAVQIIGRLIHYASNSNNQQPTSKIWIILRG